MYRRHYCQCQQSSHLVFDRSSFLYFLVIRYSSHQTVFKVFMRFENVGQDSVNTAQDTNTGLPADETNIS